MSDAGAVQLNALNNFRQHSGWFIALGIIFIIGGAFAIFAPFAAGLAVTIVVAIALAILGVVQIVQAWSVRSWGSFIWQLIVGLIILIGGIMIYFNPLAGVVALTLVVAAVFIAKGVVQIIMGFQMRPHAGWGWILTAGILALVVGLIIAFDWPISTAYALGTLAGISLIFTGWSYIALAMAARRTA